MTKSDKLSVLFFFKNEEKILENFVKRTTVTCNMLFAKKI